MALKDDILALPTTVGEGTAGHLGNHATLHAAAKGHEARLATMESRASITWSYEGTGTPSISSYPGVKIGDYIVRKSDGQEWRVDEGKLTQITPKWVPVVLEPQFQGGVEYTVQGKTVTIRLTNFAKTSEASLSGSKQVGYLPVTIRAASRKVGIITGASNLNALAKAWVEGNIISVMPGLTAAESWTDTVYNGQVTFMMN